MASLDSYQYLLRVKVARVENKALVWLWWTFFFFLFFLSLSVSLDFCALPCNFSNQTLSFTLFFILSLIFWLMFILFQITCKNQNLLQFHPHLICFLHLFVFYLVLDFLVNISFIWNNLWKLKFVSISSSFDFFKFVLFSPRSFNCYLYHLR
jgi:hypothetical protein